MENTNMDSPEGTHQPGTYQKYRTTSVCVKMKFDAPNVEEEDIGEKKFVVIHEMYQCSKCYKIFNEESALSDHECVLPGFVSANVLKPNIKLPEKKYIYDCDQCELSFTQKRMLRKHKKIHRVKRKIFECRPCLLEFPDKESLTKHRENHVIEKWFSCEQCDKRFAYEKMLDWHCRRSHKIRPPPEIPLCTICDRVFSNQHNLKRHQALHGSDEFVCEICGATFPLKEYLNNHKKSHIDEKPFMCEKCGKRYKKKDKFQLHVKKHDTLDSQPEIPARNIPQHMRKFGCDKCGKRFVKKIGLHIHSFIHSTCRKFQCDFCQKSFRHKLLLKNHIYTHTRPRYTCEICKTQYCTKASYGAHMKIHDAEKVIRCDICEKKFSSQWALNSHSVVHSRERPYKCNLCHNTYTQKGTLKKHSCRMAPSDASTEYYECRLCHKQYLWKETLKKHSCELEKPEVTAEILLNLLNKPQSA